MFLFMKSWTPSFGPSQSERPLVSTASSLSLSALPLQLDQVPGNGELGATSGSWLAA